MTRARLRETPAGPTAGEAPGSRSRAHAIRALLGSVLAIVPFSIGKLVDVANGTAVTPLAADPSFTLIAIGGLALVAAAASAPVAIITYLLDRVVDQVWSSRGGRLVAGAVANALVAGGGGLALGGLAAPMWRPVERALVFTGPWAGAAVVLFVVAAAADRRSGQRGDRERRLAPSPVRGDRK